MYLYNYILFRESFYVYLKNLQGYHFFCDTLYIMLATGSSINVCKIWPSVLVNNVQNAPHMSRDYMIMCKTQTHYCVHLPVVHVLYTISLKHVRRDLLRCLCVWRDTLTTIYNNASTYYNKHQTNVVVLHVSYLYVTLELLVYTVCSKKK